MALVGDIKDLPLADIIQINCLGRNVARLLVRFPIGDAIFYFQDGEIYDARLGQLSGVKAIYEALKYEEGAFRIDASVTTSERTIFKSWAEVLMDGMRILDEQNAGMATPGRSYPNFDPQAFLARQTQGIPIAGKQTKNYIGKIVNDKYRIITKIKEGELGVMYQATHIQMDVSVAVKIMHPYLVTDQAAVERFRRGAHAAAKIHHPNAISVLDFGITKDDIVYLAMEFLRGETFRDRLQRQKRVAAKDLLKIIRPVCSALEAAHRDQIIHRDLKPENIMIYESGGEELVKVLDFGMAKLKSMGTEGVLTSHGLVLGTHSYMSPELCEGTEIDNRSDVYALGVVLYEALTGSLPFNDPTAVGMALKHIGSVPSSMRTLYPEISENVDRVVMKALEKKPSARQQSAAELAKEFEQAVTSRGFTGNLPKPKSPALGGFPAAQSYQGIPEVSGGELGEARSRVPKNIQPPVQSPTLQNSSSNDTAPQSRKSLAEERFLASQNQANLQRLQNPASFETKPLDTRPKVVEQPPVQVVEEVKPQVVKTKKKTNLLESNLVLFFLSALIAGVLFLAALLFFKYFNSPKTTNTQDIVVPEMVKIAGGNFTMGRDGKDAIESPAHEVTVKDFFLSRNEITNKEYQAFILGTNYRPPLEWNGVDIPKSAENLPVVNITWEDAQYYCYWLSQAKGENYRLPTEEEWEFAARGVENKLYPWGDELIANSVVFAETSLGVSSPITSAILAKDRSVFGVLGLAGNVSEWTSSKFTAYPGSTAKADCDNCYVVRGGNFKSQANELVTTFRQGAKKASETIGFRIAKN
ncbi:MAG: SUMF1/EgtB/PvdO family nonheme iron enzyme [Blastocatellia bacterium]